MLNTQDQSQNLSPLSHLEDQEKGKDSRVHPQQEENLIVIELTPQIPSKSPFDKTETTPNYTPMIPMSTEKSQITLITNHQQSNKNGNDDDDDETPFAEIPKQDNKPASLAQKEDKDKTKDYRPSTKKSSIWKTLKSRCKKVKPKGSVRCFVKGSNLKKFLCSFILILMLANVAILIPFAVDFSRKKDIGFEAVNGALSSIAFSLAADPILDIKVRDAGSSCPEGYRSLLLGTWPGTTDGCECSSYLRKGVCNKSGRGAIEKSCDDISSINPINMYDWSGEEWCVLKAKPESQYKKAPRCAKGFRKCSSGICVLETLDCPVTKVKLEMGSIVTESVEGDPPVIGFAITPNDVPCFSDNYFASGPVASYVLIDGNGDGCSKYGPDNQYSFALDKLKQKELFDENDFPKKVYDLPDYAKVYKKTESVLSYRRRLSVAEKDFCLNANTEILESPSDAIKDLNRFLNGTLISALAIHGLLFLIVIKMIIAQKCMKTSFSDILQGGGERKLKIWILFYSIFGVMDFIDVIVMFATTVHFRAKMIVVSDYLRELDDKGCFLGFQAQAASSDYQAAVNDVVGNYFRYSLSLFVIGSFSILSCGYLLWKVTRK